LGIESIDTLIANIIVVFGLMVCALTKAIDIYGFGSDWFEVLDGVRQGCVIAPDLFLASVDWIMQRTLERSSLDVKIGCQSFTDLQSDLL